MGLLNYFTNWSNKMLKPPSDLDKYINKLQDKYGVDPISFLSPRQAPQAADFVDAVDLMSQTNSAAGVLNPAEAMLESHAQAAEAGRMPTLYDPRSDNLPVGMLEDPNEESPEAKRIREGYEDLLNTYPVSKNMRKQPFRYYG